MASGHHRHLLLLLQKVSRTLGLRRCGEQGALVRFQNCQPLGQVGGVVLPGLGSHIQTGADEIRPQLCNEFFHGVGMVAKPLTELARQSVRVPGPVN